MKANNFAALILVLTLFSSFLFAIPGAEAGEIWEREEIGALKYDHEYPFVVARKNTILYSSEEDGGSYGDIWRMNLDGTGHVQLTDNDFDELLPTGDDAGTKIVYTGYPDGVPAVFVMNFNGGSHTKLIDTTFSVKEGFISSDGDWVVFSSNMDNDTTKNWGDWGYIDSIPFDIWKCEIDGSDEDQLTDHAWDESSPTFSPDGERIAFVAEENDDDYDIHIMDEDGGSWDRQFIVGESVDETYPSFSPDGKYLLYNYRSSSSSYDAYAVLYDFGDGSRNYLTAETVDEDGDDVEDEIKGRYIRFCPPFDSLSDVKVIYSSKGDYGSYLRIWTAEKARITYEVEVGPVRRRVGDYNSETIEGAMVSFEYCGVYYENLTDDDGYATFVLPVGKLSGTEINASIGAEWVTWNSYYSPAYFSDDVLRIGSIKLMTERSSWGAGLAGALVGFELGGITYENLTDAEGYVDFIIVRDGRRVSWIPEGTEIRATYDGETLHWLAGDDEPSFKRYMIKVGSLERITEEDSYYGDYVQGAEVSFTLDGKEYRNLTDEYGYAYFGPFNFEDLPDGTMMNAISQGQEIDWLSGDTLPDFVRIIYKLGPVKRDQDESGWLDEPVTGARVSFELNGKLYENHTDSEGYAYFTLEVSTFPEDIVITAEDDGDEITWESDDREIPQFEYEESPISSFWNFCLMYAGVGVFVVIIIIAVIVSVVKNRSAGKKANKNIEVQRLNTAQRAFDTGKGASKRGSDLFNRGEYVRALGEYRTALSNLEMALQSSRRDRDEALSANIEGMLTSVRSNIVSAEVALDKRTVEEGYRKGRSDFDSAVKKLGDDRIFEARRELMEISRNVEQLITVAKSRNFTQAIKNLRGFQVKVRENVNVADMKLSEGVETVSPGSGPDVGGGSDVMASDVSLYGELEYEGGYVVQSLTIRNNTLFDVRSGELRVGLDENVIRLSHTSPQLPVSANSVSLGLIPKGAERRTRVYFDPQISTGTYLDTSLIYVDNGGRYRSASIDRMNVNIEPPSVMSDANVNIAALKGIIVTEARYQDSRIYGIDPKVPIAEVLGIAKEAILETNFTKVRDTRSRDMESSWFFATSQDRTDKVIVRASVMTSTRTLEIFAACSRREHLAPVLVDISRRVTDKLGKRWRQLQPVTQVNVEIKDSIIQRSNLDFGTLASGAPGTVNVSDSVITRSSVGAPVESNLSAYRNLLLMVLEDGVIDENEERMLAESRKNLGITAEQHRELLAVLNR